MVKLLVIKTDPHIPDTAKSPCTQLSPSFMPCAREVPASRSPVTVSTKHSWEEMSFIQQRGSVAPTVIRKTRLFTHDLCTGLQRWPAKLSSLVPSFSKPMNRHPHLQACCSFHHAAFVHLTQTCDMAFNSKVQALSFKFMFTFFNFGLSPPKSLFN